jgi:hypothetical protein
MTETNGAGETPDLGASQSETLSDLNARLDDFDIQAVNLEDPEQRKEFLAFLEKRKRDELGSRRRSR